MYKLMGAVSSRFIARYMTRLAPEEAARLSIRFNSRLFRWPAKTALVIGDLGFSAGAYVVYDKAFTPDRQARLFDTGRKSDQDFMNELRDTVNDARVEYDRTGKVNFTELDLKLHTLFDRQGYTSLQKLRPTK
jgi:hypothetical protein